MDQGKEMRQTLLERIGRGSKPCNAKVCQLDVPRAIQQDVARFQVPVDDAMRGVEVLEGEEHLLGDALHTVESQEIPSPGRIEMSSST
jgi:hypothetical protein